MSTNGKGDSPRPMSVKKSVYDENYERTFSQKSKDENTTTLKVVAAAINRNDSGEIVSLPAPARHHDIIKYINETYGDTPVRGTQGFLLSDGRFAMRKPALSVAMRAGQLIKDPIAPAHGLFSEDVW